MNAVDEILAQGVGDAGALKLMSGVAQASGESGLASGCQVDLDGPGAWIVTTSPLPSRGITYREGETPELEALSSG